MELPVYLPNLKSRSTKDLILRLLTERARMTNQQIFLAIKKKFGVSVTYQAVRQALVELTENDILTKEDKLYALSLEWIRALHEYSALLMHKFVEGKDVVIVDEKTTEVRLKSLNEMGNFLLHSFHEQFFDMRREKRLIMYVHHLWFPFFNREKRALLDRFFGRNENLVLVRGKTFVDRAFSLYYRRFGMVRLGMRKDMLFDVIIQGDCVAKIHMPKELRERMDCVLRHGTRSDSPSLTRCPSSRSTHTRSRLSSHVTGSWPVRSAGS